MVFVAPPLWGSLLVSVESYQVKEIKMSIKQVWKDAYRHCRTNGASCLVRLTAQMDPNIRKAIFVAFGW